MVGSLFMLAFQDSLVKLASADVSLWQFQLLRAAFNLALLLVLARLIWRGGPVRPRRLWAVALRSLLLVSAMVFFFGGIPVLSLPEIAAGLYIFPLFVAVLSALVLGERVGPRRVTAILVGFAGALLILKPASVSFQPVSLMPVGAAFCYAATILTTRKLCREEHPATLALGVSVGFICLGTAGIAVTEGVDFGAAAQAWPYLFTGWHPLELWMVGIVLVCSTLNLTSNIGLARAYQSAESSWLAPFDYTYLIFATFWGAVMWNHLPDLASILGMCAIAASGSYVAWRERAARQTQEAP